MPNRIPITDLKEFAKKNELTHCILLAHDGKLDHVVTYGDTVENCAQAAEFGNTLKKALGWPDSLMAIPNRVKTMKKKIEELEKEIERLQYFEPTMN